MNLSALITRLLACFRPAYDTNPFVFITIEFFLLYYDTSFSDPITIRASLDVTKTSSPGLLATWKNYDMAEERKKNTEKGRVFLLSNFIRLSGVLFSPSPSSKIPAT